MNAVKLGIGVVFVSFSLLTAYAVEQYGFIGLFEAALSTTVGVLLMVDLTIALGMVTLWLVNDARAHGKNPIVYVLMTVTLGSVGPLLYLLLRRTDEAPVPARALGHGARA